MRYSRQILIKNFGEEGQEKLRKAKVAIVGVGGLGCAVSQYLAVAGIGELILIDYQTVEMTNLNRQILYCEDDIGKLKVEVAKERLKSLNPEVKIKTYAEKLKEESIKDVDVVVDCLDNFEGRYLLNEICVKNEIPFVHGAVENMHGQITTIIPYETPCLKCVFNLKDRNETLPILGFAAGTIGTIQAGEVIKLLSGVGETLKNKLLIINLANNEFNLLNLKKNPKCSVCSKIYARREKND
jgi:molybdopterin/thiamine biosynthesis adenylyltransferase